ncbi:MAG: GNAT family N-acetyltransferase [bacterium]
MTVSVRIAQSNELADLTERYRAWGYDGGIAPGDVVFVAERAGRCVGLVRLTFEHDVFMLRGMFVAPSEQRRKIGSMLLGSFTYHLAGAECYCIPFAHLPQFYERGGFVSVPVASVPSALAARVHHYRAEGHDVIVMRRPPQVG